MQKPSSATSLNYLSDYLHSADKCTTQTNPRKPLLTPASKNSLQGMPSSARHSQGFEEYYLASQGPCKKSKIQTENKKQTPIRKKPRELCRSGYSFKTLDSVLFESQHEKKHIMKGDQRSHKFEHPAIIPFDCSEICSLRSGGLKESSPTQIRALNSHRKLTPQKTLENIASSPVVSNLKKQASLFVNNKSTQSNKAIAQTKGQGKKSLTKKPRKRLLPSQPIDDNPAGSPTGKGSLPAEHFQVDLDRLEAIEGVARDRLKSDNRLPSFMEGSEDEQVGDAPSSKVSNSQSTEISPPCHQPNRSSVSWKNFDTFRQGIEAEAGQSQDSRQPPFHLGVEAVPVSVRKSDCGLSDAPGPQRLIGFLQ